MKVEILKEVISTKTKVLQLLPSFGAKTVFSVESLVSCHLYILDYAYIKKTENKREPIIARIEDIITNEPLLDTLECNPLQVSSEESVLPTQ